MPNAPANVTIETLYAGKGTGKTWVRATQALASNGAVAIDASSAVHAISLAANATSSTITNAAEGGQITVTWIQDGTGGRTYAWPANCKFAAASAPSDTTANRRTTVSFIYDGTAWQEISRAVAVG